LEQYSGNTGDDGHNNRDWQWGSVELAHSEIIEGNDSRDFIKVRNF